MKKTMKTKSLQYLFVVAEVILPSMLHAQVCGHAPEEELSKRYPGKGCSLTHSVRFRIRSAGVRLICTRDCRSMRDYSAAPSAMKTRTAW